MELWAFHCQFEQSVNGCQRYPPSRNENDGAANKLEPLPAFLQGLAIFLTSLLAILSQQLSYERAYPTVDARL